MARRITKIVSEIAAQSFLHGNASIPINKTDILGTFFLRLRFIFLKLNLNAHPYEDI
jgi:hypothetical protein